MAAINSSLADFREEVQRCMRCGYCRALCPTWDFVGWESGSPRGRIQMIKALLDGEAQASEHVADRMYKCALCGYCLWRCPSGVKTTDAIRAARDHLVRRGCYPRIIDEIAGHIGENHNLYGLSEEDRTQWIALTGLEDLVKTGKRAEFLFFPGCVASFSSRAMGVAAATSQILDALGANWTILGDEEWCCGNPLLLSGKSGSVKRVAEHNVNAIRRLGAKVVVTSCAGCYRTFTQDYPRFIGNLGFQVYHVSQVLETMLNQDKLKFSRALDVTVAYHDPCELGRHAGVYEPPRRILREIPGVKLVELPNNRFLTRCCGGGGILKATNPEIAIKLANKKLEEAHRVKAKIIASSCPSCKLNLSDAIAASEGLTEILDITEIVAWAMNLKVT